MRIRIVSLIALAFSSIAFAQTTGLEDLVGARAGQAEATLQARGYVWVKTETGDDRKWATWWNAARGQCVSIATMDGRYASITPTPAPDCGRTADSTPSANAPQVDMALVCYGDGQRPTAATRGGYQWNDKTRRYEYGTRTELETQHFDATLTVHVTGTTGEVRLPRSLIPPLNSGGRDQWWPLTDVVVGPDRIDARYRLNGLNRPTLSIDRRSGRIRVKGAADYAFNGSCDRVDSAGGVRF